MKILINISSTKKKEPEKMKNYTIKLYMESLFQHEAELFFIFQDPLDHS